MRVWVFECGFYVLGHLAFAIESQTSTIDRSNVVTAEFLQSV